jgi:diacylglycerol kinase (ATP)
MRCVFFYNPLSGKGKVIKHLDKIERALKVKFENLDIYATKSMEDTIQKAKEACGKYDVLIFAGGDGTFNNIATGVSSCHKRPILGYIPTGTVNDIARNLNISRNIKKALKVIIDGNFTYHDVGKINGQYFIYVSGIGTFTGVSYRTKQRAKRMFGRLAYVLDGLKEIALPQVNSVRIETEKEVVEMDVPLLLVVNTISVGGLRFNPGGHLNDGYFDIIIVKKGVTKGLINIVKLFTLGIGRKRTTGHFLCLKSKKFKITVNEDVIWCVDGEAGPKGEVIIQNLHNHLQIYVPKK